MARLVVSLGCLLGVLLVLGTPAAAATYQQAPSHAGEYGADGWVTADEFSFPAYTEVSHLTWWGGYFNPNRYPTPADDFVVRFYDDAGGLPGQVLKTYAVGNGALREATGADVVPPEHWGFPSPEFVYSVVLPEPFPAEAGVVYWISIHSPTIPAWIWEASAVTTRPGVARTNGAQWGNYFNPINTAFHLADASVPPCLEATGLQRPSRADAYPSDNIHTLADDFVLPEGGTPTKVTWWGGYFADAGPELYPDAFVIEFRGDEAGHPGVLLATYTADVDVSVTRTQTGCTVRQLPPGVPEQPEYRYEATLPPGLSFDPGRKYWLTVRNRQGWVWELSGHPQTPDMQRSFFGSSWELLPGSVAFDLAVTVQPPPTGCTFPGNEQLPAHDRLLLAETGNWVSADDFVVLAAANLMRVEWWGGYLQPQSAPPEDFTVSVFADAGGQPGPVLASYGPGLTVIKRATGEPLQIARSEPEYRYTFELPAPLPLERNHRYWLSVSNVRTPNFWGWETSASTGGQGLYSTLSPLLGPWYPAPPFEPQNAALRVVMEGTSCEASDRDDDGVDNAEDSDPDNPLVCGDTDADSCEDCSSGSFSPHADGADADGDHACDAGDPDDDNDGASDQADNCPLVFNPDQEDRDGDGVGALCDGPHSPVCAGADQPPAHSAAFDSLDLNHVAADDFVVARDSYLMRLVWWGGFRYAQPGEEIPPESFTIRVYGESDGRPGALLHTFTPDAAAIQKQATGDPLLDAPPPAPAEYRYTFEMPAPLPLAAGRYWLAIGAADGFHRWSWSTSTEPIDAPAMYGIQDFDPYPTAWFPIDGVSNLAFTAVLAGGACAADTDGDGVFDGEDDPDADLDGVADPVDNCPLIPNPGQSDVDRDGVGSACDGPHSETCGAGSEQPPAHTSFYYSEGRSFTMADNFHLERGGSVMRLQWWGGLFDPPDDRLVERFTIRIYEDQGGVPGPVRYTLTPGRRVRKERTGETLAPWLPSPEYRYTLDLALPAALAAGRYWVGIGAEVSLVSWFWSTSEVAGLPGLVGSFDGTPDHGPWVPAPGGENMALVVTVAGEACAADTDEDGVFDGEDVAPHDPLACTDSDADLCDDCSSGVRNPAADGADLDADGLCDRGDPDDDADGVADAADNCALHPNPSQADLDQDGLGDHCDDDDDGDAVEDTVDNCLRLSNPGQADFDRDGLGDDCDADDDADQIADGVDLCAASVIPETTVPTVSLVAGRYALVNGDDLFDTVDGPGEGFTIAQTRGCTCAQVIAHASGEKDGHYKHGCSGDLIRAFIVAHP